MVDEVRDAVDATLRAFLDERRRAIERAEPSATVLVDEIRRLLDAGGKRIRPILCRWGYLAAGGVDDGRVVRAAAALELLHTMALVHDDLIDGAKDRRAVPATAVWFSGRADELGAPGDPEEFGRAVALLVGDLAAVLADELLLASGFTAEVLTPALARSHEMRERMAAGEYLDVGGGAAGGPEAARRAAALKGGAYTVEGPLLIGSALAGGSAEVEAVLSAYARPLGLAFQLRDDLDDGEAPSGEDGSTVDGLVEDAIAALDPTALPSDVVTALTDIARAIAR
jgi:geranylgeranyl diphosphate synthase type I